MEKIIFRISAYIKREFPMLKRYIKKVLYFIPFLDEYLRTKSHSYLVKNESNFKVIKINDFYLMFSDTGLKDQRGIGRVTHELYNKMLGVGELVNNYSKRKDDKQVFFYSSIHWCPIELPYPSVIMVHDVIPLVFPDLFPDIVQEWRGRHYDSVKNSEKIVTISKTSAFDICKFFNIENDKVDVVYNGISDFSSNASEIELPFDLEETPYFVYIGAVDPHKNISVVLNALLEPIINHAHLCLIGNNDIIKVEVKRLNLQDRVHFLGRLDDEEMHFVLKNSVSLVFPSIYEGFGLPPFEAAKMGAASICTPQPVVKELMEDSVFYAEKDSSLNWAKAMSELIFDLKLREELSLKAKLKADDFTWDRTTDLLIKSLSKVAKSETNDHL